MQLPLDIESSRCRVQFSVALLTYLLYLGHCGITVCSSGLSSNYIYAFWLHSYSAFYLSSSVLGLSTVIGRQQQNSMHHLRFIISMLYP